MSRTKTLLPVVILSAAFLWLSGQAWAQDKSAPRGELTVEVVGLKNSKGVVRAGIFTSDADFPLGVDGVGRKVEAPVRAEKATLTFPDLPHGTYAIVVYHDEDADGLLDKNWVGMPREGAAVHKPVDSRVPPPDFEDCKFEFGAEHLEVRVQMNYL